jgi:hypothetical protein
MCCENPMNRKTHKDLELPDELAGIFQACASGDVCSTEPILGGMSSLHLTLDARDFGTFDTQTCHESLLVKDKGVGIFLQRRG